MATRLRSFSYDVKITPAKVDVETETKRTYAEDGKITVSTRVNVCDTVDVKQTHETSQNGKIKPYGLDTDAAYDVEVKEKVEPAVIQEHIESAVKKATRKKSK
jgi:hypothetical protein